MILPRPIVDTSLIHHALEQISHQVLASGQTTVVQPHRAGIHPLLLLLLVPVFLIVSFYGSYVLPPVLAGGTFLAVSGIFFLALDSFLGEVMFGTIIALVVAIIAGFVMANAVAGMAEPSTVLLFAALGAAFGLILEPVFRALHVVKEQSTMGIQMISIIGFFTIIFGYLGQFVGLGTAAFLSTSYVGACAAVESLKVLSTSFFGRGAQSALTKPSSTEMMADWLVFGATLMVGTTGFIFQKYCFKGRGGDVNVDTREYEPIG